MKRKNQEEILDRHNVMLSSIMVSNIFYVKVTVRTNRNSVSMEDMAVATTKAASMASEMGVAEDSLSGKLVDKIENEQKDTFYCTNSNNRSNVCRTHLCPKPDFAGHNINGGSIPVIRGT